MYISHCNIQLCNFNFLSIGPLPCSVHRMDSDEKGPTIASLTLSHFRALLDNIKDKALKKKNWMQNTLHTK